MIALDRLSVITTQAIALPNKALATSLQQVAGITGLSLPQFAAAVAAQQTVTDLPLIAAQTQPVSQATIDNLLGFIGVGTGPEGTITIDDVLGTAAGVTAPQIADSTAIIGTLNTAALTLTYQTMVAVLTGVYSVVVPPVPPDPDPTTEIVIPPGVPGTGTYASIDAAISALIVIANSDITSIVSASPAAAAQLNSNFNTVAVGVQTDRANQARAQLVFADLEPNDQTIVSSFALTLPGYGVPNPDGTTVFLTSTATTTNLGGQAIVATLRQGANDAVLSSAGIQTTTQIPI